MDTPAGEAFRSVWPYAALAATLVATRTIPPLRDALQTLWRVRPVEGELPVAPLYHPAFWLVAIGLVALLTSRPAGARLSVVSDVVRIGWKPATVTVVYAVFARIVAAGGLAAELAAAVTTWLGGATIYLSPLFGALSGFLTSSNTASNGMMMPVQAALASAADVDIVWAAALQNVAGSTFTLLSPTRIAAGCALLALVDQEGRAYALVWPFAAVSLLVMGASWFVIV